MGRETIKDRFKNILEEIKTPEYKQKCIQKNQKYLNTVSMDWQLGFYIGENIVDNFLPTLSTDMIQSRRVIEVSEEDKLENVRLDNDWYKTTKYQSDWNGEEDGDKKRWDLYFQHNKMLEKKYLPQTLECPFSLIRIDNENEFKKGLIDSLWNCDMCSYNIEPENIKIENDLYMGFTTITFKYNSDL